MEGVVTPIHAVLTAKTGHLNHSSPHILIEEGVELLHFLLYIIGLKDKMCV